MTISPATDPFEVGPNSAPPAGAVDDPDGVVADAAIDPEDAAISHPLAA